MKNRIQLLLLFLVTTFTLASQENFTVRSLSIFKNGQSFVVKEGTVNTVDSMYKIQNLPNALFGTYWFTGNNNSIKSVTNKVEKLREKQEKRAFSIIDLFHANKSKKITVYTQDKQSFSGIIEDFDLPEEVKSEQLLQRSELSSKYKDIYDFNNIYIEYDPILMLKVDNKWITLKPSNIERIEFLEKPNTTTTANILVEKPVITIHFRKKGAEKIRMMYLQDGLSWTPVYKLELINDTEGKLALQAEVNNQVEDIKNTDVDFVIGVANFSYANKPATLLDFNKILPVVYRQKSFSNNSQMFSNAVFSMDDNISEDDESDYTENRGNNSTSENEDLYFYTIKRMTLSKGSSANFPLFEKNINLKHIYTCSLPESTLKDYRVQDNEEEEEDENEQTTSKEKQSLVNHYIEIINNTGEPLTSGPVLIMKNSDKALAQSTLYFTAKGNNSQIFVTNSPDIYVKDSEEITATKLNAKKRDGYSYALLTIKGKITINNTKSKDIELNLNKNIMGKVISSSIKYKISIEKENNTNQSQKISFNMKVKANTKETIEYTYQMYSRQYN